PGPGNWQYTEWTEVGLDLTAYIGQTVTIEFRVANCYPGSGGSLCSCGSSGCTWEGTVGGVSYRCTNIPSCPAPDPANDPNCAPTGTSNNNAGSHIAFAYIHTYCKPLIIDQPQFCAGDSVIQICAPAGYRNYLWEPGP